jgi:RNA polymerase sigma-70 factor (ECF subfamily)
MSSTALTDAFSRSLAVGLAGQFGQSDLLELTLTHLLSRARGEWPDLEVDELSFVEHVAARVEPSSQLDALHVEDLYISFACLLGDPEALRRFDERFLSRMAIVFRGAVPSGMADDDLMQNLKLKLFVRQGETPPRIASYSGRGSLMHWLRAAAVRMAQDYARSTRNQTDAGDEALIDSPAAGTNVEVAYLKQHFAPEFKAAFQEALAELSAKDKNLLRLHYLDGISPEEIGRLYQTHRTTVWRWLSKCRQDLFSRTRELLGQRVNLADSEFSSLMNAVQSQLDVSLTRMLKR